MSMIRSVMENVEILETCVWSSDDTNLSDVIFHLYNLNTYERVLVIYKIMLFKCYSYHCRFIWKPSGIFGPPRIQQIILWLDTLRHLETE